jgi:TonB family protein
MRIGRLPPHYQGPDVASLIADILRRGSNEKGEFESTVEFQARRQTELSPPLPDGLPIGAERIFVLPVQEIRALRYDADRQAAMWQGASEAAGLAALNRIGCSGSDAASAMLRLPSDTQTLLCRTKVLSRREADEEVQTRLGLWVTVRAHVEEFEGVSLCDLSTAGQQGVGPCASFFTNRSLPLEVARARELLERGSGRLRVAVLGTISPPFALTGRDHSGASLDNPVSRTRIWSALRLQMTGLLFFHQDTGEILLRLPDPMAPVMPPVITPPGLLASHQNPEPQYPAESRRRAEQGTVSVRLAVSETGQVTGVEVVESSGRPRLDEAAKQAALRWRFAPATRDGAPVPGAIRTSIHFRLSR